MCPLVAISKRQGCVSLSTPEAKLFAGSHGLMRALMSAFDMYGKCLASDDPIGSFR